ncbi:ankyrin repeat domain-containing protein 50-like [Penaeus chinensis]|uniref:ankyrin repeat domain-containing protein 50-like n=1 Tax=Penaeus chinensis TaxID=139456 RepID=UPI001FB5C08F|nr:ankyrin repeat domain-containing protein 50-like [Penaeus chinensis]
MRIHFVLVTCVMVGELLLLIAAERHAGIALLAAASKDRKGRLLEILERKDLNINYSEKTGWYRGYTALMWAADRNSTDIAEALLRAGADVNHRSYGNETALFLASQRGYLQLVRLFLDHDAEPDVVTKQGFTALLYATWNRHSEVVLALLGSGADPNFQTPTSKYFPLYLASRRGDRAIAEGLLQAGARPDMQTSWALQTTAVWRRPAIARDLIRSGANVDLQDNTGQAALHKASLYGFSSLVRTFIDAGAEVDLQDRVGRTALIWACRRGQNAVIKDLLEAGADPNIRDNTGRDALSWATRYKKNDSAELLLKYCPDLRLQEGHGRACGSSTSPSPSVPPIPQDASATSTSPSAAIIRDSEYSLKIPKDTIPLPTSQGGTTTPSVDPQVITTAFVSPSSAHSDPKDNPHSPRVCGSSLASSAGKLATQGLLLLCVAVLCAGSS